MSRSNLFDGDSYHAQFALVTYRRLMSRGWVTYADVMADYLGLQSAEDLPNSVSNCEGYGELKKAFRDVRNEIIQRAGEGCFEEQGNNRSKRFKYVGKDDDPLADMRNSKVINNLKQYWQFCQDSAGFFPTAWLDYFFKDCKDLLDIKTKKRTGERVLSASLDRELTNIELLPFLYESIVNHQVLLIDYKPYQEDEQTIVFHPHYLKEFNGRWFLLGHAESEEPEEGFNIALDRIVGRPREKYDIEWKAARAGFYQDHFKDIVGVSQWKGTAAEDIRIRAHTLSIFKLTETKKIHPSQTTMVPFGKHKDGKYGDFIVHIKVNNEFIGQVLQFGDGLEIISPESVRSIFNNRIQNLMERYR